VRNRMPGGVAGVQPGWLPPMPILDVTFDTSSELRC
jgi:hypothetical protein